jgi:hypothetical protein
MSDDDFPTGRASNEAQAGFEPMAERAKEPEEQEWSQETYETDQLEDIAREVSERRGKERSPLIERNYVSVGGEDHGSPRPAHETVSAARAADDLKAIRDAEVQFIEQQEDRAIADAIDEAHGRPTQTAQEEALAEWRAQQQQAQQQAEQPAPPDGIDPALYEAMKHPEVQRAIQEKFDGAEKARQQYAQATFQSAQLAAASLIASVPELQGLDPSQYGTALEIVSRQNPQKGAEIRQHFSRIEQLFNIAQQAKAQEAQLEQQKAAATLQSWRAQEAAKFDRWQARPENAARAKAVGAQAAELFQSEYGVSRQQLQALAQSQPLLHSEIGQRLIIDALSYRQALRTATANPARAPLPPVQKPGVSRGNYHDSDVESARSEFLSNPNPRSAARMIAARRRAS